MTIIMKGEEYELGDTDFACFNLPYQVKAKLLNDLHASYIRPLHKSLRAIDDELKNYDAFVPSTLMDVLLPMSSESEAAKYLDGLHHGLVTHMSETIDSAFTRSRMIMIDMFRRIIVDYMNDNLGIMAGGEIQLNINISVIDKVIREFTIVDLCTGEDYIEYDILKILDVSNVERYLDSCEFIRVLEICILMLIDIATHIAIRKEGINTSNSSTISRNINSSPYSYYKEFKVSDYEEYKECEAALRDDDFLSPAKDSIQKINPPKSGNFFDMMKDESFIIEIK